VLAMTIFWEGELVLISIILALFASVPIVENPADPSRTTDKVIETDTFAADVAFLRQHTNIAILSDKRGVAQVAVAPAWQGRVMTSTAQSGQGHSFGWINLDLIASRQMLPHFNPLGGEDRVWLGPEGGQFSIYFANGAPFDLDHWFVPKALDTLPFHVVKQSPHSISFRSSFELTNYSGTRFEVLLKREVSVLEPKAVWAALALPAIPGMSIVGYESNNVLTNVGHATWTKETGLLSVWILGMFNPSAESTIAVPFKMGSESVLGAVVTSDYFGSIPPDRFNTRNGVVFLRADGQFRSKIGINPKRSLGKLGSYDSSHGVLTIVQFNQPQGVIDYVNSLWRMQDNPFAGDALNSYNDGPPAPGRPPMGPFFELESSSPAAALAPGASLSHLHRTIHLMGPEDQLDRVSRVVLGVSLAEIQTAFSAH
jgi:hypothetical protein